MFQFDDSCYVDAKQCHLASFSTRNSTLNTSLRKPIRMEDFIQLCDSIVSMVYLRIMQLSKFLSLTVSMKLGELGRGSGESARLPPM